MNKTVQTSHIYNLISAILAFLIWGGWAYYINSGKPDGQGVVSGLAQGVASSVITLFMVRVVTILYHRFQNPVFKLIFPGLLTVAFTTSCMVSLHLIVGTHRIFQTILPAMTVGFSFCVYTCWQLKMISRKKIVQQE